MSTSFADLLKALRVKAGLNQSELSEASNTLSGIISMVEKDRRPPSKKDEVAWAKALNLSGEALDQFRETAVRRRALGRKSTKAHLLELETLLATERARLNKAVSFLASLPEILRQNGIQVPDAFTKRIEVFRESL